MSDNQFALHWHKVPEVFGRLDGETDELIAAFHDFKTFDLPPDPAGYVRLSRKDIPLLKYHMQDAKDPAQFQYFIDLLEQHDWPIAVEWFYP